MQTAAFSPAGVTYTNSPVVTGIAPVTGSNIGGTPVTITGTDFQPGAVVLFGTAPGGISGLNCAESGGTTLTCLTPADSAGVKDITVVNVDGKLGSATAAYTTIDVRPTISAITPASGPTNGSAITITGTNFQTGARVTIGGLPVGNLVVVDSTTITANTPALPVGPADVTITNPDTGTITSTGGFTYALGSGPINYIQRGGTVTDCPLDDHPGNHAWSANCRRPECRHHRLGGCHCDRIHGHRHRGQHLRGCAASHRRYRPEPGDLLRQEHRGRQHDSQPDHGYIQPGAAGSGHSNTGIPRAGYHRSLGRGRSGWRPRIREPGGQRRLHHDYTGRTDRGRFHGGHPHH